MLFGPGIAGRSPVVPRLQNVLMQGSARVARRAVELGRDDAVGLTMGGFALALVLDEAEDGAAFIDRALTLNPSLAVGWLLSGWVHTRLGNPEITIERATRAIRLSPLDPFASLAFTQIGAGHLYAGRYAEASSWAEKGLLQQTNSAAAARVAAASHALAGRLNRAKKAMAPAPDRSGAPGLRSQANYFVSPAGRPRETRRGLAKGRAARLID